MRKIHLKQTQYTAKKFEEAAGADNVDALYNEAVKAVDMAATKGLIHKTKLTAIKFV